MNIIDLVAITLTLILQAFLFTVGMNFNKKIIIFSATTVYFGMLLFFLSVFLSDVKITSEAFLNIVDYQNFLDKENIGPFITVIGTVFAYFAIIILTLVIFRYKKYKRVKRQS